MNNRRHQTAAPVHSGLKPKKRSMPLLRKVRAALYGMGFYVLCASCGSPRLYTSRITLDVDSAFTNEGQWAYVSGYKSWISGNESALFDSVWLKPGQTRAKMKIRHGSDGGTFNLLFSKKGPYHFAQSRFLLPPKSRVTIKVTPNLQNEEGELYLFGKGSRADAEDRQMRRFVASMLEQSLDASAEDRRRYTEQSVDSCIQVVRNSKYACSAFSACYFLKNGPVGIVRRDTLDELDRFLKAKFPEYRLFGKIKPATMAAKRDGMRIQQLIQSRSDRLVQDTAVGSKLDVFFFGLDGQMISADKLPQEYVLVDFWASWCKPCQKEVPYLRAVQEKYGDRLAIYAVTIDRFPSRWKAAIERDSTQSFIHAMGASSDGFPNDRVKGLGIRSIPANFLLDKDRRIVAKNLRGEELMQVLDSLMNR